LFALLAFHGAGWGSRVVTDAVAVPVDDLPHALFAPVDVGDPQRVGHRLAVRDDGLVLELAVPEEECRDVLFVRTDGSLWHDLVERRGSSDKRYAAWLGRLWLAMLVDPATRGA
jgi:hypothetical protein